MISQTPGIEDLREKLEKGLQKPKKFEKTLFVFLTNSISNHPVTRRVPIDEWGKFFREQARTPGANVILFDYNEWDCPQFNAFSQEEFTRLEGEVKKGISNALSIYGIPKSAIPDLTSKMEAFPNEVSHRVMIIVKHINYSSVESPILEAIRQLPNIQNQSDGWAVKAWDGIACRGVKQKISGVKNIISFAGMPGKITAMSIAPKGQVILYADNNGTMALLDFAASRHLYTYEGHKGSVNSLAISPDSSFALSGGEDKTVRTWLVETVFIAPVSTIKCSRILEGHTKPVTSVAISPDGLWGLSGSKDKTARLWSIKTGQCLRVFSGHTGGVNAVAFSTDENSIITGSDDCDIRVWDVGTGRCKCVIKGHRAGVTSLVTTKFSSKIQLNFRCGKRRNIRMELKLWRKIYSIA